MTNIQPPDNPIPNQPDSTGTNDDVNKNLAVNLIRTKVADLYANEPDAATEEQEAEQVKHRSRHQQFMYELSTSGKDLVQIQTEWHNYYQGLSDEDKKQVWDEFFKSNKKAQTNPQIIPPQQQAQQLTEHVTERAVSRKQPRHKSSPAKRKAPPPKLTWKHHLQSALFGLSVGAIMVFIVLFGFFNEVFIAPFIQPSRHDTATPIIIGTEAVAPSATPEVIIPKINVEIPIDYSETSTNEAAIESDLNGGVVHYPTTSFPGETGNAAFFGHSSNNIFNPGKYKFAFVLLHELVQGDIFYLTYNGKVYVYKVFLTAIVSPSDVGVLNPVANHVATATLITCDPPGTSINRLIVIGDQISPDPAGDGAPTPVIATASQINQLPGNGPTLWHRYFSTVWGKIVTVLVIIGVIYWVFRWYTREFRSV